MEESTLLPLLLITVLAALVPVLSASFRKVRLPIVVGEILVGVLIGRSGLNLVHESPSVTFLAGFGFAFLMFLSGLEVDFSVLTPNARSGRAGGRQRIQPALLGLLVFALTLGLALLLSFWFQSLGLVRTPLLMALILSTTSLGIVVPVLKETKITASLYGQAILAAALIADIVTLLLISVVVALQQRGLTPDLLLVLVLALAFVAELKMGRAAQRSGPLRKIMEELSSATAQVRVRGAFALIVTWVVLAEALGLEIILGAFLAGALMSLLGGQRETHLREKLDAIGFGFFIPVFFIMVGVRFDLRALLSSSSALLLLPLLLAAAFVVKLVPALAFRLLFSWRESLAAGALLSSRLSLIIAASAIALSMGAITDATNSAVILVAIVTCTTAPLLFLHLAPPVGESARRGMIIVGASELGLLLAERLAMDEIPVTIVGRDEQRVEAARQRGFNAVWGDPLDSTVLEQAGAASAEAIVSISTKPEVNQEVSRRALSEHAIPVVVAWASQPDEVRILQEMGVLAVQPAMATALALEGALRFPATFDLIANKQDDAELGEAVVRNPALNGMLLRRVSLPSDVLMMGIRRDGEIIVPHGDTQIRMGDVIMLVGRREAIGEAEAWLQQGSD